MSKLTSSFQKFFFPYQTTTQPCQPLARQLTENWRTPNESKLAEGTKSYIAKSSVGDNSPFFHWIVFPWKFLIRWGLTAGLCKTLGTPTPPAAVAHLPWGTVLGWRAPAGLSHQHWHTCLFTDLTHTCSGEHRCSVNRNIFFKPCFSSCMTVKRNTKKIIPKCYLHAGKSGSPAYVYIWIVAACEFF